ncbi:MAG: hypothetical protein JO210_05475 [Acidobacteriaceae bacterium]|nr:hypothetical protein [Acidobacteriaceae bacterium]
MRTDDLLEWAPLAAQARFLIAGNITRRNRWQGCSIQTNNCAPNAPAIPSTNVSARRLSSKRLSTNGYFIIRVE